MRAGGMAGLRLLPVALVLGLLLGLCGGCGEDAPPDQKTADAVKGKTPVVRPDVTGRGEGGSAVLAPDYRRGLTPELAEGEETAQRLPPRSPRSPQSPQSPKTAAAVAVAAPAPPAATTVSPTGFPVAGCRQLVLVVAPDFNSVRGTLRRFSREGADGPWRENGERVECVLGRAGLGAGRGLLPLMAGPLKRQGDHRTPAGLFSLPEVFGYATAEAAAKAGVRLPYQAVTDRSACLTDPTSPRFGRIVGPGERSAAEKGRQERMKRDDGANLWGVVIGHNRENPDPEAGTCLFVNVRAAGGPPTGGSIGLPEAQVMALAAWLDPAAGPLLAVLPEKQYQQVKRTWGLP